MAGAKRGRPTKVAGTRKWFREIVEDPDRRQKVIDVIDAGIKAGNLCDYWKAVEHGFGRPPQALDVKIGGGDEALEFEIKFADGSPAAPLPSTLSTPDVSGPGS